MASQTTLKSQKSVIPTEKAKHWILASVSCRLPTNQTNKHKREKKRQGRGTHRTCSPVLRRPQHSKSSTEHAKYYLVSGYVFGGCKERLLKLGSRVIFFNPSSSGVVQICKTPLCKKCDVFAPFCTTISNVYVVISGTIDCNVRAQVFLVFHQALKVLFTRNITANYWSGIHTTTF